MGPRDATIPLLEAPPLRHRLLNLFPEDQSRQYLPRLHLQMARQFMHEHSRSRPWEIWRLLLFHPLEDSGQARIEQPHQVLQLLRPNSSRLKTFTKEVSR